MDRANIVSLGCFLLVVGCSSSSTMPNSGAGSSGSSEESSSGSSEESSSGSSGESSSSGSSSGSNGSSGVSSPGDAGDASPSAPAVSRVIFCSPLGNACPHGDCESTEHASGKCDPTACSAYHDSGFDTEAASSLCKPGTTGAYCLQIAKNGDPCNKLGNAGFRSYAVNCAAGVGTATYCGETGCKGNPSSMSAACE